MMQYGFKNYEGFKELFVREDGKRKNGVLLSMFKNRAIKGYLKERKMLRRFYAINSMGELFTLCDDLVLTTGNGGYSVQIFDSCYRSDKYASDNLHGVCEDGDFSTYRYCNMERNGSIFKMKIGKLYRHLIQCSDFGKLLNDQVILYMCEEMTRKWFADNATRYPKYHLFVDKEFKRIYSSEYLSGNFYSCMTDNYQHSFYEDSVKAKAAYLCNDDGLIVARCVIFTEVLDEDGNVWRLAERQYASGGDDVLKQMLVYALIKGGHIDGYKKVGADCHNSRAFVDINDESLSNKRFSIKCELDGGDTLSYQDSFKWYYEDERRAYNYHNGDGYCELDVTDSEFQGAENYDEYHECYTSSDLITVYYNGNEMSCSEDDLEDFEYVNSVGWVYYLDVSTCPDCESKLLEDHGRSCYSEITEEWYCCEDCKISGENEYKSEHWQYSEYDDEYFESVETFFNLVGNEYVECTISEESLDELGDAVVEIDGALYLASDILDEWIRNNK